MFSTLAVVAISLTGVLKFLLFLAIIALLVVGARYLFGIMGWSIPQPIWAIIGIILFLICILYFFGGGIALN
jgi:uncharacterized membrane protein (GlpM family)